jgi:phosphoglycolate phosphatase
MTEALKLVVFDVDGTLVDSQGDIVAAMGIAFANAGLEAPERAAILGIVGLSLDVAIPMLAPGVDADTQREMVKGYKDAYVALRSENGAAASSPLYPHARKTLQSLHAVPEVLLGVATGKSRRGLDKLMDAHDLHRFFVTQQVSDHHPSKPHPAMLEAALSETGVDPENAVMIGDTVFDMEMAQAAGVPFIGVTWGYHPAARLTGAVHVLEDFRHLPDILGAIWEEAE